MVLKKTKGRPRRGKSETTSEQTSWPNIAAIASSQDRAAYVRVQQDRKLQQRSLQRDLEGAKRFEKALQLEIGLQFAANVPFKFLGQWTGRQATLLYKAADRYGIPVRGATWSVRDVVKWVFDFLAKHGARIHREDAADGDGFGAAREELYKERIQLVRLERRTREGALIPADVVVEALQLAGTQLRTAALQLQREFGPRAWEIYNEALKGANDVIETLCDERPLNEGVPPAAEVEQDAGDDKTVER